MVPPEALAHQTFYQLVIISYSDLIFVIGIVRSNKRPNVTHGLLGNVLEHTFLVIVLILEIRAHDHALLEIICHAIFFI
jgi:hypothetical protein